MYIYYITTYWAAFAAKNAKKCLNYQIKVNNMTDSEVSASREGAETPLTEDCDQ